MLSWTRKRAATVVAAAAVMIAGCAAFEAETPKQRYYAALAEYNIYLRIAVAYAESPEARPEVVAVLTRVNQEADAAKKQVILSGDDATFAVAANLLRHATTRLRQELVKAQVIESGASTTDLLLKHPQPPVQAAGTAAILLLVLELLGVLSTLLAQIPDAKDRYDQIRAKIKQFIDEDRDPTDEEFLALIEEANGLSARLRAANQRLNPSG